MIESTDNPVRVRFAPSPTGLVHVGSLRTALFNFLFARNQGGTLILRVEDTDQSRFVEGAMENMIKVLGHVGITFDEGYVMDAQGAITEQGNFGPYLQSKRKDLYRQHAEQLITEKKAYYCFCSEERLEEIRKEQTALKKPPMYDRLCRTLSKQEISEKMEAFIREGKLPVVRFAMPLEGQTIIHDIIYGDITYENNLLDDQIIIKSDGFPTYHLAVVVDDHFMEITHVIRGEEWIPSTPKHLELYKAFGWQAPAFAHMPLIVNPDKTKLSKRQGDVAVEDFLQKGYLKEALVNFVAFLGWNPKTEKEIFSLDELVAEFDLAKVNKSGAVFDIGKLDWMNSMYIRQLPAGELADALIPYWTREALLNEAGTEFTLTHYQKNITKDYLEAIAELEKERLKKLSEIGERTIYFFKDPEYEASLLVWKKADAHDAREKLQRLHDLLGSFKENVFTKANLETELKNFIAAGNFDTGAVLWPLRAALTGAPASPGPFEVAATLALGLGKDEVLKRIQTAIRKLESM